MALMDTRKNLNILICKTNECHVGDFAERDLCPTVNYDTEITNNAGASGGLLRAANDQRIQQDGYLTGKMKEDRAFSFWLNEGCLISFEKKDHQWRAVVSEQIGYFSRVQSFSVIHEKHQDVGKLLHRLEHSSPAVLALHIHVLWKRGVIFIGLLGLRGGSPVDEACGSGEREDAVQVKAKSATSRSSRRIRTDLQAAQRLELSGGLNIQDESNSISDLDSELDFDDIGADAANLSATGPLAEQVTLETGPSRGNQKHRSVIPKAQRRRSAMPLKQLGGQSDSRDSRTDDLEQLVQQADVSLSEINSIPDLVQRINDCDNSRELEVLLEFGDEFVDAFAKSKVECLGVSEVKEYFSFVYVEAKDDERGSFLRKWFYSVANKISKHRLGESVVLGEMECSLHLMDIRVFHGDPSPLIKLLQ